MKSNNYVASIQYKKLKNVFDFSSIFQNSQVETEDQLLISLVWKMDLLWYWGPCVWIHDKETFVLRLLSSILAQV